MNHKHKQGLVTLLWRVIGIDQAEYFVMICAQCNPICLIPFHLRYLGLMSSTEIWSWMIFLRLLQGCLAANETYAITGMLTLSVQIANVSLPPLINADRPHGDYDGSVDCVCYYDSIMRLILSPLHQQ